MQKDLRALQLLQLDMAKRVQKICKEHNLKYTMLGGTLLGAVRHKGFIPWDDDLDFGLPRADYEKLMAILEKTTINGCFLQEHRTEEHYVQPYAKLRLDGTEYVETFFQNVKIHQGVFIDIFPLDKVKKPGSKGTEIRRKIAKLITFAIWRLEGCTIKRKGVKKIEYVTSALLGLLSKKRLICLQKKLVERENKNWDYFASMYSSNYSTEKVYFKATDFTELVELPFEDALFFAPQNWHEVLQRMFKNYMQLPPEDKRSSGHEVLKIKI